MKFFFNRGQDPRCTIPSGTFDKIGTIQSKDARLKNSDPQFVQEINYGSKGQRATSENVWLTFYFLNTI